MKPRLVQQQSLQWKLNQSLIQSIHILQLPGMELLDYLGELSNENPLMDAINYDYEIEHYRASHVNTPDIGEINPVQYSMYEQLRNQLYTLSFPKELEPIIDFGIDSLNHDGYLEIELEQWADACDTTLKRARDALAMIQSLEPAGIGARSLSECIMLQLKAMNIEDTFILNLMDEHLEWIATNNSAAISKHYQVEEERALAIIERMKRCHPKPGQLLGSQHSDYIIPEASIFKENGSWEITFHKWAAPTIKINDEYGKLLTMDKDTTNYLKEKYKQIEVLQQAIAYRTSTLEQIIQMIIEKQSTFFENGPQHLKPLTLREIALELDIHVSTVSRAIKQKYVQTDHGVLPIKFFLQTGIRQTDGKEMAAVAIKQRIYELIQAEHKSRPLSDETICRKLKEDFGIEIARRTIMKYRGQLQIPSSLKRKRGGKC
ncbi:RNA polymerase sigma-54 factor [Oceanobacillus arenosus]|uniref:RNA polymerase sigma-54 factor n=1 Tax=Oceanobacillus arenosus TaxID=1229153 RepID=A0A3D8PKG0_9BACI|nr:RNA polymerase factor sigma-54 [Oceanobacillus arenosus]RDW16566.1 RNA polymerase sigma-54 factor [Oceanobacillus arenosus]